MVWTVGAARGLQTVDAAARPAILCWMRLHPFKALRPVPELVASVASPPYDVVSRAEAAALATDNPLSFLHVVRAEIDLAEDVEPHDARVYAKARENLERLIRHGTLQREAQPALYLYRLVMEGRTQVGVVGCVHVEDYERDVIKKHETTRPDKEDDRTRHILTLGAHAEAVLLAYRGNRHIDRLAREAADRPPLYDFTAAGGVRHTLWTLPDPARCVEVFDGVPGAYVADGHHRSASAWRAARQRGSESPDDDCMWFPAALFPAEQLRILPYNRVIADLGGQAPGDALTKLEKIGRLSVTVAPMPPHPGSFCLYLDRRWYLLELAPSSIDRGDALGSLDVTLLQERVLAPVLGVGDPRTDKRIDFVGGLRGPRELAARVDCGEAALAVSLYPTTVDQLMAVSDLGQVMPPKSTWFEPKLASGLFVHTFDRAVACGL
jgi:uncharacterized protein (DUF1015 family)